MWGMGNGLWDPPEAQMRAEEVAAAFLLLCWDDSAGWV